jgi:hypothetical protein
MTVEQLSQESFAATDRPEWVQWMLPIAKWEYEHQDAMRVSFGLLGVGGVGSSSGSRSGSIASATMTMTTRGSTLSSLTGGRATSFSRHALNQAISRNGYGVAPSAYIDAIKNGKVVVRPDGTTRYRGKSATVVVNSSGRIITMWGSRRGN